MEFKIKDFDGNKTILITQKNTHYFEIQVSSINLVVTKTIYIYSDLQELINYFATIKSSLINQANLDLSWHSVEQDFLLKAKLGGLGKVKLKVELIDTDNAWNISLGLSLTINDLESAVAGFAQFT